MKFTKIGNNIKIESFDSVREFVRVCAARPLNKSFAAKGLQQSKDGGARFTGTENWEEAQSLLASGYKDGCKDLLSCKSGVTVANEINRARVSRNYAGYAPCVPAAVIGMPKTMYHKKKVVSKQPVISLYYDCGVHARIKNETLVCGGKNLYSLVNYLDKKGVRVNLFIMIGDYSGGKHAYLTIKAKNSDMPVNPQLISYPLIHPSFFRRHVFRWIETSPATDYKTYTHGYGSNVRDIYSNVRAKLQEAKILNDDSYYTNVQEIESAKSIEDMLLTIGIKL